MSQPSITNCPSAFLSSALGRYIPSVQGLAPKPVPVCFSFPFFFRHVILIQVAIAPGFHLFPFRTEKLSPVTPMVLRNSGRVGSRRFQQEPPCRTDAGAFLFVCPGVSFPRLYWGEAARNPLPLPRLEWKINIESDYLKSFPCNSFQFICNERVFGLEGKSPFSCVCNLS